VKRARRSIVAAVCLATLVCAAAPALCQTAPPQKGRARRPDPPAPGTERRPSAIAAGMIDRANYFINQGRCEEAIPILERLTTQSPRIAVANEMLAGCYIKAARAEDAAALLERCLEEDPGYTPYLQDLARAYIELGQKEKAVLTWRRLLEKDTKLGSMHGVVAKMEQEAGLYEEAIATLRAGASFKENAEYYMREMIRLERVIGRDEDAFRDALLLVGRRQGALEGELRGVSEIFKESKRKDRLVAIVDSMVAAGNDRSGAFRMLKTVFLVDEGSYNDARRHLFGKGEPALREDQIYALLVYVERMHDAQEDPGFAALNNDLMQMFLDRFGGSVLAPGVMLMMASGKREAARNAGPAREKLLEEALRLADGVKRGGLGAPYFDRAAMFKARVLFEDLHRGAEALEALSSVARRDDARAAETAELRMRILLASGDWNEAASGLKRLSAGGDTTVAFLGRYGLGRLAFLAGRYEESVGVLSDLAEKHPSSAWANDALELAMEVKGAMRDGAPGALALYRAAALAESRGEYTAAIDSLAALEERFPQSSLAPRAIFMKAGIEEASAKPDAARADFTRLAESWPLDDLAPRALERNAALSERQDPAGALAQYGLLMERYPEYPFMERVRERYIALGKLAGAEAPKKGSK